jgi:hypothetical protein
MSSIITLIWKHCHDEWLNRNTILHGNTLQTRNQARLHQARLHQAQFRIRALYDLRQLCSPHARTHWYYPSLEVHIAREPGHRQLEQWFCLNEARILSQTANRQHHLRIGQRSIDEYSPTSYRHYLYDFERFCFPLILTAPITREQGWVVSNGTCARRRRYLILMISFLSCTDGWYTRSYYMLWIQRSVL